MGPAELTHHQGGSTARTPAPCSVRQKPKQRYRSKGNCSGSTGDKRAHTRCDPASRAGPASLCPPSFGCRRICPGTLRSTGLPDCPAAPRRSRERLTEQRLDGDSTVRKSPACYGGEASWHRLYLQVPQMTGASDCPFGSTEGPAAPRRAPAEEPGRDTGGRSPSRYAPGAGRTEALSTHGTATDAAWSAGKYASECRGEERGERGRSGARQSRSVPVRAPSLSLSLSLTLSPPQSLPPSHSPLAASAAAAASRLARHAHARAHARASAGGGE